MLDLHSSPSGVHWEQGERPAASPQLAPRDGLVFPSQGVLKLGPQSCWLRDEGQTPQVREICCGPLLARANEGGIHWPQGPIFSPSTAALYFYSTQAIGTRCFNYLVNY